VKNKILIYIIITYSLASIFPWWIIVFVGTLIGFLSKTSKEAILSGVISLVFVWLIKLIINFFIADYLIIDKIKLFLNLSSFSIICISLLIPLILGMLSALFGYQLKKVSKS
tara:strand:- start:143 stop:478 length:336 start_codon:yes stop_codon:yes gene_type:complete